MKELSIEEKAKAYDKAIAHAKILLKTIGNATLGNLVLKHEFENMFPELKIDKSEDEKIRCTLINHFKTQVDLSRTWNGLKNTDILAWLEKQELKSNPYSGVSFNYNGNTWGMCARDNGVDILFNRKLIQHISDEKQGEQKPDDKVETKFHEGDWVILTAGELSTTLQIAKVDTNKKLYWFNDSSYLPIVDEECLYFWSIQDAKDGDVLYSLDSKQPFIFKHRKPNEQAKVYCGINIYGKFFVGNTKDCIITTDKYIPATKEQRDLLFQKMYEAGYEWDAEKKELRKIEQIPAEWSEEDENIYNAILDTIYNNLGLCSIHREWFKNIKERLKSLKDRYTWKPSKEQLHILESVIADYDNQGLSFTKDMLCNLYEQLKKLREE